MDELISAIENALDDACASEVVEVRNSNEEEADNLVGSFKKYQIRRGHVIDAETLNHTYYLHIKKK